MAHVIAMMVGRPLQAAETIPDTASSEVLEARRLCRGPRHPRREL